MGVAVGLAVEGEVLPAQPGQGVEPVDGAGYIVHPLEQQMVAPDVGELVGEDGLKLGVCQLGEGGGIHQQHRPQRPRHRDGRVQGRFQQGWGALPSQGLGALGGKAQEPLVLTRRAAAQGFSRQQQLRHPIGQEQDAPHRPHQRGHVKSRQALLRLGGKQPHLGGQHRNPIEGQAAEGEPQGQGPFQHPAEKQAHHAEQPAHQGQVHHQEEQLSENHGAAPAG